MTLSSVTIARRAQWGDAIVDFGWRMTRGHIDQRAGLVLACADRPVRAGPAMTLTVREEWVPGSAPMVWASVRTAASYAERAGMRR